MLDEQAGKVNLEMGWKTYTGASSTRQVLRQRLRTFIREFEAQSGDILAQFRRFEPSPSEREARYNEIVRHSAAVEAW